MKEVKGSVFVIISAVIFGCMPLTARMLYAQGCNSVSLVVYRYSMSLPILFVLALREQLTALHFNKDCKLCRRRRILQLTAVKRAMRLNPTQVGQFFILSLVFCATPLLLFSSYNYIPSGSATTIHFSYPVFVILAAVFIFREKATVVKIVSVLFCILGLACFYEPGRDGELVGIALALSSGVTYSFYMIFFDRSVLKFIRPFKTNFYLSLFSAALALSFAISTGSFVLLGSANEWLMALCFSVMLTVVACVLFQMGIAAVGAQKSAVLSTFEPITSVALGAMLFHETVGIKTVLGAACILVSVLVVTFLDRGNRKQREI